MRHCATAAAVLVVSCTGCDAPGGSPFFESRSSVVVLDSTPAAEAANVPIDAVLEIELNRDGVTPQAAEDAFDLVEVPALTPVLVSVSYDGGLVRITPAARLDLNTRYRASLTGLLDALGRSVEPFEWEFTTVNPPAPALTRSIPEQGSLAPL